MAYYDALITRWATLTPGTTAQKLAQLNALTVGQPKLIEAQKIVNAIVPADLVGLTTNQLLAMTFVLSGGAVNAGPGTTVRLVFQSIFAGKTTTLANLAALVAPLDSATVPWWQANGYPRPFDLGDIQAAGLS